MTFDTIFRNWDINLDYSALCLYYNALHFKPNRKRVLYHNIERANGCMDSSFVEKIVSPAIDIQSRSQEAFPFLFACAPSGKWEEHFGI